MGNESSKPYSHVYTNFGNNHIPKDTYYRIPATDTGFCNGNLQPKCLNCTDKQLLADPSSRDCIGWIPGVVRSDQESMKGCLNNSKAYHCEYLITPRDLFKLLGTVYNRTSNLDPNIIMNTTITSDDFKDHLCVEAIKYYTTVDNSIPIEDGSYLFNWLDTRGQRNLSLTNFLKYCCNAKKIIPDSIIGGKLCNKFCLTNNCASTDMYKCVNGLSGKTEDECLNYMVTTNDIESKYKYLDLIKKDIDNQSKDINIFTHPNKNALNKLIKYSTDSRISPEDRGRFDYIWNSSCNRAYNDDPDGYVNNSYCSCIIPDKELYKYPIAGRPDCINAKCATNINAYRPWSTIGSKGTMDCPSVCTQTILAQSGNLSIIENINLAQSCYAKSGTVAKVIDNQVIKEISESLLVYHISCVLTNSIPIVESTEEIDIKLTPYINDVVTYNTFINLNYIEIFDTEVTSINTLLTQDIKKRDELATQLLSIQNTDWSAATTESYTDAKNKANISSQQLDMINESIKKIINDTISKMEEYKVNKEAINNEILDIKKDLANRILSEEDGILVDDYIDQLINGHLGIDVMEVKLSDVKKILDKYNSTTEDISTEESTPLSIENIFKNNVATLNGLVDKAKVMGINISDYIPSSIINEDTLIELQNKITDLQEKILNASTTAKEELIKDSTSNTTMWIIIAVILSILGVIGVVIVIIIIIKVIKVRRNM
jgi:hypothetical protein